jgi:ATP-binding cassette subfamily F protein uup
VIDVIKEYGEFIPLMKGDFGVSITRAFPFDAKKQYDFVDRLSGGN